MTIDLFCDGLIPKDSTLTTCWNSMLWLDPQQQRAERGRHSKNSSILEQSPSLSMLKMSMEDMLFKQNHTTRHKTKHTGKASGSGKIRVLEYYFVYILEIFRRTANAICQSCFWHPKPPVGFQWNMTGWRCGFFLSFHILGIIIPTDELIFFNGVGQPPTRSEKRGEFLWISEEKPMGLHCALKLSQPPVTAVRGSLSESLNGWK